MNIKKVLSESCILLDLKGSTKADIIAELLDHLVSIGQIQAGKREAVLKALMEREQKMSTGMQFGVAIPHCKTDAVDRMSVALAIKRVGIDFNSLDSEPSRIFVMTVSPVGRTGPHIQFLAEVSRILSDAQVRERILGAKTKAEVMGLL